jgi:uncharacterized membrane protein YdjX (TVP38/TMEM64 family)
VAVAAILAAVVVAMRVLGLGERLAGLRGWIESFGPWGPLVFLLLYILAVVIALPGSVFAVTAGALFGSVVGVILMSVGSTVGAVLAFLIARYAARGTVERRLAGNATFQRLDRLTEEHGAVIVAFTRLVPLFPFNLLNYGFGLTRVPLRTYAFWSWLCMIPGDILYVAGSDALFLGISGGRIPWALIAVVGVTMIGLALATGAIRRRLAGKGGNGSEDGRR